MSWIEEEEEKGNAKDRYIFVFRYLKSLIVTINPPFELGN